MIGCYNAEIVNQGFTYLHGKRETLPEGKVEYVEEPRRNVLMVSGSYRK
jgi:hypothetical protein